MGKIHVWMSFGPKEIWLKVRVLTLPFTCARVSSRATACGGSKWNNSRMATAISQSWPDSQLLFGFVSRVPGSSHSLKCSISFSPVTQCKSLRKPTQPCKKLKKLLTMSRPITQKQEFLCYLVKLVIPFAFGSILWADIMGLSIHDM